MLPENSHRELPVSASQVLRLKVYATTAGHIPFLGRKQRTLSEDSHCVYDCPVLPVFDRVYSFSFRSLGLGQKKYMDICEL